MKNLGNHFSTTKFLMFLFFLGIVRILIQLLDPWAISEVTYSVSANAVVNIAAPLYRYAFKDSGANETGDLISTIIITDDELRRLGDVYPPSYGNQLRIVANIATAAAASETNGKPLAIFLDFAYLDARDGIGDFGRNLSFFAADDTIVGVTLSENSGTGEPEHATNPEASYPPLRSTGPGILTMQSEPQEPREVLDALPAMERSDLLQLPAAASWIVGDPARYALAPRGWLSPAVRLALWACADRGEDGSAKTGFAACRGDGPVAARDVHATAFAAAARSVALSCAEALASAKEAALSAGAPSVSGALDPKGKALASKAKALEACEQTALDHAAIAGWAPAPVKAEGSGGAAEWVRARLADYAAARRDGHYEGALEGRNCALELDVPNEPLNTMTGLNDILSKMLNRCTERADEWLDQSYGPAMQVFWGAGPRDGGPIREAAPRVETSEASPAVRRTLAGRNGQHRTKQPTTGDAVSAFRNRTFVHPDLPLDPEQQDPGPPYSWALVDDVPVIDPCLPFRFHEEDRGSVALYRAYLEAFGENLWAAHDLLGFKPPRVDICAYHRDLIPAWLDRPKDALPYRESEVGVELGWYRTMHYARQSTANRVVMVAASVEGAEDTHEARGIRIPGVWIHAMALDNVLTMGRDYRRASVNRLGFDDRFPQSLIRPLTEMTLSGVVIWIYLSCGMQRIGRRTFDRFSERFGVYPLVLRKVVVALGINVLSSVVFIGFAVGLFLYTSWPIFDWLSAAALVLIGIGLVDDEDRGNAVKKAAGDGNTRDISEPVREVDLSVQ